jgi:hypothetical protein
LDFGLNPARTGAREREFEFCWITPGRAECHHSEKGDVDGGLCTSTSSESNQIWKYGKRRGAPPALNDAVLMEWDEMSV